MIERLHYLTQDLEAKSHAEQAQLACSGGVRWVQLRVKGASEAVWETIAAEVKTVCDSFQAQLIVNDNVALAKKIGAAGVHLGVSDMDPLLARSILGPDAIIGGSAHNFAEVQRLKDLGINYIGLGPLRFTQTKAADTLAPVLGPEGVAEIVSQMRAAQIDIPVIVIGAVCLTDLKPLSRLGVHGVAVASAINLAKDPQAAAKDFVFVAQRSFKAQPNSVEVKQAL